ncbi:hypothetical protein GCM10023178_51110 [Actinomadura luteofluorescens]
MVDGGADDPLGVRFERPAVQRDPQPHPRVLGGQFVVPAQGAAQVVGQRMGEAGRVVGRRQHDDDAVAAVLLVTAFEGDARRLETAPEGLV